MGSPIARIQAPSTGGRTAAGSPDRPESAGAVLACDVPDDGASGEQMLTRLEQQV